MALPFMSCKILIADDSPDDRFFIERALRGSRANCQVFPVADGEAAIQYISGLGQYADRNRFPFPDAILLDLKMPRMDGFEVLRWLRTHHFQDLPVVAHSSSSLEPDVRQALELGANLYLCKAPDFAEVSGPLVEFLEQLSDSTSPKPGSVP